MTKKTYDDLRSARWYATDTRMGHTHRQRTSQAGYSRPDYKGKPVIGILNTWSELNPCHIHFRERSEHVKRGVWQAGGFPVEVPVASLGEPFMKPTTGLYRNFLAMEVEEMLRCHPIDGVVLMGGCDKTTPAMIMGATTMNLPDHLPAGRADAERPLARRAHWVRHRYVKIFRRAQGRHDQSGRVRRHGGGRRPLGGHCMTMGTASTDDIAREVLGMTLPGAASIPAPDSRHIHMASQCGRRIVEMVWEDLKPRDVLTRASFENAIVASWRSGVDECRHPPPRHGAARAGAAHAGGLRRSGRAGPGSRRPASLGPLLMEDFFHAGGLKALLAEIRDVLHLDAATVNGRSLGDNLADARRIGDEVIRPRDNPLYAEGGLAVLRGSLAPQGAVIKRSAASADLLRHTGRAIVFEGLADMVARIDDPALDVDETCVLVLRNAGPIGGPGMPEWGMLPLPKKLLERGIRDMVRISDARMSGTQYGTVVLMWRPRRRWAVPSPSCATATSSPSTLRRGVSISTSRRTSWSGGEAS
jgi:dihydroxy-acid dehydratase